MGVSTTITHGLLTIAAIIMASLFVIAVISQLNNLVNSLTISIKSRSDSYRINVNIIYAYYDESSNKIGIFLKNTGDLPYSSLNNTIDIFVKDYEGSIDYYNLKNEISAGRANITEYNRQDNILEPGETVYIELTVNKTYVKPLEITVVLATGYKTSYVTS
ncbi:MAG: flagellin [Thermoprotei archaeon]